MLIDHLRHHALMTSFVESALVNSFALQISIVTIAEIYAGASMDIEGARAEAEDLFGNFGIVPLDEHITRKAGEIKRRYRIDLIDAIIAASAMLTESVLITKNVKHFEGIPELEIKAIA
ncbi:MAG: PIN domain-containing protein [bacterium]|nr:PIN domain-containing protein [bacterium]